MTDEEFARAARDNVFKAYGQVESMCAKYVYNMAHYFKFGELPTNAGGHGNMGTQAYYNSLTNIGYTLSINESHLTRDSVAQRIANSSFPPGSVVCYQNKTVSPGQNGKTSHYVYGHTQFYVGGSRTNGSSFPSSMKDNYGCYFVYGSRNGNDWEYRVYTPNGFTNMKYCEQEYVPTISRPASLGQSVDLSQQTSYSTEISFYNSLHQSQTASVRRQRIETFINTITSELGVSRKAACAFAGCIAKESQFNPTAFNPETEHRAFGIAQWTVTSFRQQALWNYAGANKTDFCNFNKQLEYLLCELESVITAPNGGTISFTRKGFTPEFKRLSSINASFKELVWCCACRFEMAGSSPYKEEYYTKNTYHVQDRVKEGLAIANMLNIPV